MLPYKVLSRRMSHKSGDDYVKPITGFRKYISQKFMRFIESYERVLETKFPKTFKIYRVFTIGTKDFYNDSLKYFSLSRELFDGKRVNEFSYNELMIYYQMPKDMIRVAPVLLLSALPMAQYLIFPLAYMFPKQLLSHHFWSIEQKQMFQIKDHTKRLHYYRPVLRCLQSKLPLVPTDDNLHDKCKLVFDRLGSGTHPSVEQVMDIKQCFISEPYGLDQLKSRHLSSLCRMHGLNAFPLGMKSRLESHIGFVRELDLAIDRDGIQTLNFDQIKRALFMRGLNPIHLSNEEMTSWLQMWISIAHRVDSESLSLLLHCPILLAYNNPSNWRQIH